MISYVAKALRWRKGWELHVSGVGVTQCTRLAEAEQQVRDLIEITHPGTQVDAVEVRVVASRKDAEG